MAGLVQLELLLVEDELGYNGHACAVEEYAQAVTSIVDGISPQQLLIESVDESAQQNQPEYLHKFDLAGY